MAIIGQRLVPGLLDRYLSTRAWEPQQTDRLPAGHPPRHDRDNVDAPVPGDRGAHGPFDATARTASTQVWVRNHRGWLILVGVVAGALLFWKSLQKKVSS